MAGDWSKPVVIITGASRGIGAACARELTTRGWQVVLFARSNVDDIAASLGGLSVQGDITQMADLERLVSTTVRTYGRIDAVLVSTGDPAPRRELLAVSDEQWHAWLDLLFLDVVRLARLVTPHLIRGGGGSWVNIGSADLREPDPVAPHSATIRNAVAAFTKLYAQIHAPHGIRMNVLSPSYAWDGDLPAQWSGVDFGRIGRPASYQEVATAAAFLLSEESSFVSGIDLKVDGGSYSRGV